MPLGPLGSALRPVEATQTETSGNIFFGYKWDNYFADSHSHNGGGFKLCEIPGIGCMTVNLPPGCPQACCCGGCLYPCLISIDTTQNLVSWSYDSYFCAGAYLGVGWPFGFKAAYPDKIGPGEEADIQMSVENKLPGGANGLCNLGGGNALAVIFAGLSASVTVQVTISPGDIMHGWIADIINGILSDLGIGGIPSITVNPTLDLASILKAPPLNLPSPYFYETGGGDLSNGSPLRGSVLPSVSCNQCISVPISIPGLQSIGALNVGLNFGLTPAAQDVSGAPYADKNAHMADASPSGQTTVGDQGNVDPKTEKKFEVKHDMTWSSQWQSPGNPNGAPPPKVDFGVTSLQQDVTVTPFFQPTLSVTILEFLNFPINIIPPINLPQLQLTLPGKPDVNFKGIDRYPGKPDLIVSQIIIKDLTLSPPAGYVGYYGDQLLISAVPKNIAPAAPAGYDGWTSFTVYDGNTQLAHITYSQGGPGVGPCNPFGKPTGAGMWVPPAGANLGPGQAYTQGCDLYKGLEITLTEGIHVIKVCVNPDHAIDEVDFTNDCLEQTVNVFTALVPMFDFSVSITPTRQTIPAGDQTQYEVSVTWARGAPQPSAATTQYVGIFDITSWEPPPPGGSISPSFTQCSGPSGLPAPIPCTSTLTIGAIPGAQAGTYLFTVAASDSIHTHTASASLIIQAGGAKPPAQCEPEKPCGFGFSMQAPTSIVANPGTFGHGTISITPDFGTPPALPIYLSVVNCPSTSQCQINWISKTPYTTTLAAKAPMQGSYRIQIKAEWGGVTRYTWVTVVAATAQ